MEYTLFCRYKTDFVRELVTEALDAAFKNGLAGSYELAEMPGGWTIAIRRSICEEAFELASRLPEITNPAHFTTAAIAQITAEMLELALSPPSDDEEGALEAVRVFSIIEEIAAQLPETAWLPFAGQALHYYERFRASLTKPLLADDPLSSEKPVLMLVQASNSDGEDLGLFVMARCPEKALSLWRTYFRGQMVDDEPKIFRVPRGGDLEYAIGWDQVLRLKLPTEA